MTITNIKNKFPKSISIKNKDVVKLLVHGQCVFIFDNKNNKNELSFKIINKDETYGLFLKLYSSKLKIFFENSEKSLSFMLPIENIFLLDTNYWISLDSQNQELQFGIGEPRLETKLFSYTFLVDEKNN